MNLTDGTKQESKLNSYAVICIPDVFVLVQKVKFNRWNAASARLIWLPLVSLWNNDAVHTSSQIKKKWERIRGQRGHREKTSSQITAPAFKTLEGGGRLFVSLPLSEPEKRKEWARAGDKGTTVRGRCSLYNDWIKEERFGHGFLPPFCGALIQKLCSVYRECADIFSLQPLSRCHTITALDVTQ